MQNSQQEETLMTAPTTKPTTKPSSTKAGEMKKTPAKAKAKTVAKKETVKLGATADPFDSKAEVKVEDSSSADKAPKTALGDSDAKAKAEPEAGEGEWVVNTTKFKKETEIKFAANPKRNGCASWSRYEKYSKAKTFGEYLELNTGKFSMADARYDVQKKYLMIRE